MERDSFGSKLGAIFVAAGSMIGLGSIWRFPYVAGENGGGAFLLLYFICVLILGIPIVLAEFSIGTATRKSPVYAYKQLSRRWSWLGYNSILVSLLISGFYYIVAGWSLEYLFASLDGSLYATGDYHGLFENFTASWREPFYTMLFILLTHLVVVRGVRGGLERASNVMMPLLLVILVIMAVRSSMMEGAAEGYRFLFRPDFSKAFTIKTIVCAVGQAFFALSIGLGCMIAYSSYFKRGTNLTTTAFSVSLMTFAVAILSGIVIFPAVFSIEGLEPTAGPTLIFETLPYIFGEMSNPRLWSSAFFLLVAMASLTSTISFHEVMTQYLEEFHALSRRRATTVVSLLSAVAASLCLYSSRLFEAFDTATADVLMPLGGLFTSIFAGWVFDRKLFHRQMSVEGSRPAPLFGLLLFLLRWVCPILLVILFFYNLAVA